MQKSNDEGLDLASLRVLASLLETRNTTRTAERLSISQPAVSRALAKMRVALGDPIMVRGPNGMIPTDHAEEIRARLSAVLARLDDLLAPPIFEPAVASRVFRLTTTDYGALALLPRLVRSAQAAAPGVSLEILPFSPDAFRQLADGQTDLALYNDDEVPLPLRSRKLYREGYSCLVRKGHPVLRREIDLEAFLSWPHALVSVMGGRSGVIDEALALIGRQRQIALWLPYFATAANVIAKSDLILTIPSRAAAEFLPAGKLATFAPPLEVEGFDYRLLWHERSHADPGHKWLRDLIVTEVAGDADG